MKRLATPTKEEERVYRDWIASRPEKVKAVAERFDPWSLYRMKSTGHRVTLHSFDENKNGTITLKVDVTGDFNTVLFERRVFGVDPDDLELCDPPAPGEPVGATLNRHEALEFINAERAKRGHPPIVRHED